MKIQILSIVVVSGLSLFSSSLVAHGLSYKTLNTCSKDYSEILSSKDEFPEVADFPPGVYLARSVTQGLEKSGEKYFSYQALMESVKTTPDVCYKGAPTSSLKTQAFIPTLIDRTSTHKWGNTFWSLSAVLDKLTGAIHSKRSLIPNENYREALKTQGYKVASFQKTHNEFQLRLERNIASWKETIVIT